MQTKKLKQPIQCSHRGTNEYFRLVPFTRTRLSFLLWIVRCFLNPPRSQETLFCYPNSSSSLNDFGLSHIISLLVQGCPVICWFLWIIFACAARLWEPEGRWSWLTNHALLRVYHCAPSISVVWLRALCFFRVMSHLLVS